MATKDNKTRVVAACPATCRLRWLMLSACVMLRREPAKANPDILNDAVGSASQRGYALLTGLGATGTSTGNAMRWNAA